MASSASSSTSKPLNQSGETPAPPPSFGEKFKSSAGSAISTISSYVPTKAVSESRPGRFVAWLYSFPKAFFGGILTYISRKIWGEPKAITDTVKIQFTDWRWNKYTQDIDVETAYKNGWATSAFIKKEKNLSDDDMVVKGWLEIPVKSRAWFGPVEVNRMLKHAIEKKYLTFDQAKAKGYITDEQASRAAWLKPATSDKK